MLNFILNFFRPGKDVIIDYSHIRQTPERNFFHPVFALLFTFSVLASMWQYSHAGMTILILCLILPISLLAYVPYKYFNMNFRFLIQTLIFAAIVGWGFYGIRNELITDKLTLVILGCAGLSFLMGRRKRDYGYLFVISSILMIYGALLPRVLYLYLFIGFFVGCAIIFFGNRLINISGNFELLKPVWEKRKEIRYPYILHILLAIFFTVIIFSMLPKLPTETKGMFEVSFLTEKESFAPEELQRWLSRKDTRKIADPNARELSEGNNVQVIEKNSRNEANISNAPAMGEGSGSAVQTGGLPGKDLLFTVSSPLKLYHIGRVYNEYNGKEWKISPKLVSAARYWNVPSGKFPLYTDIELRYVVEKFVSSILPAPYLPLDYTSSVWQYQIEPVDIFGGRLLMINRKSPLQLPFRYTVTMRQYLFDKKIPEAATPRQPEDEKTKTGKAKPKKDPSWVEPGSFRYYISLPSKKISRRLRKYTGDLVKDKKDNFAKGIAIRDHLRKNFPYQQFPGKVPPKKESVDYFIFELKEGHCEYFASAMAVMARIAGIPSRVVTGYSPGNFNTLTNRFEVYEYHAHAWAQLYFPEYGWLTFDATPQGSVISRTTPAGLGTLRDPFGDDWRINPPEMAKTSRAYVEEKVDAFIQKELERQKAMAEASREYTKRNVDNAGQKKKKNISGTFRKKRPLSWQGNVKRVFRKFDKKSKSFIREFTKSLWKNILIILFWGILLFVVSYIILELFKKTRKALLYRKMESFFKKAQDPALPGRERLCHLYFAVRILLVLSGYPRKENIELFAYAERAEEKIPGSRKILKELFQTFYTWEYGGIEPEEELLASLLKECMLLRKNLKIS